MREKMRNKEAIKRWGLAGRGCMMMWKPEGAVVRCVMKQTKLGSTPESDVNHQYRGI